MDFTQIEAKCERIWRKRLMTLLQKGTNMSAILTFTLMANNWLNNSLTDSEDLQVQALKHFIE